MENALMPMEQEAKELSTAVINIVKPVINKSDFAEINGRIEATRDGLLKILSNLPVSYNIKVIDKVITSESAVITVETSVKFPNGETRTAESIGTCEISELHERQKSLHNMIAKAETRGIKRSIELIFGSVINQLIVALYGSYAPNREEELASEKQTELIKSLATEKGVRISKVSKEVIGREISNETDLKGLKKSEANKIINYYLNLAKSSKGSTKKTRKKSTSKSNTPKTNSNEEVINPEIVEEEVKEEV